LKALHLIHQSTLNLTQIACDSGYYDQSHFIREFKSLTNMTPKHYQQRMSRLLGHIYYSI
ncbi:MAG TPA: AraC family transcriptional regulator, partial [Ignavibacteriales bacterium]|nr:AraC family transcriptional regulator [Ignavibacteriales bacterium]